MFRRPMLLRVLAAGGAVALAACKAESSHSTRPTRSTTAATTTTVATTTTTTAPSNRYEVKRGDTLTAIARFFGVPAAVIAATNHLPNGDRLTVGQVLEIPPVSAQLVVMPDHGPVGEKFKLNLTGAKPGEMVTFEIDTPGGGKFTGAPHTASPDGAVTASYQTTAPDRPGTYNVVGTGDRGTLVRATFQVEPSGPQPQPP